jgi:predicted secreted Zn-dependent protease
VLLLAACQAATADPSGTPLCTSAASAATLASAGGAAATASPAPDSEDVDIPNATVNYYDISGATAFEMRAQLNALQPTAYDGSKGDAVTTWYIQWNWPGYGTSSCDLAAATVSYDIKVEFPHWVQPSNPDPALVAHWTTYTHNLATHEEGHVDFVVDNYQSVTAAIKGATCTTADVAARAALDPLRQHDLDYDDDTDHGATQGATFP